MNFRRHSAWWLALIPITLIGVAAVPPIPTITNAVVTFPSGSNSPIVITTGTNTTTVPPVVSPPLPPVPVLDSLVVGTPLVLSWNYKTNAVGDDLSFVLRQSTNAALPLTNWPVTISLMATNWMTNGLWTPPIQGDSFVFSVSFSAIPAQYFWYVSASNFWWDSTPSNILTSAPPTIGITNLQIRRGP